MFSSSLKAAKHIAPASRVLTESVRTVWHHRGNKAKLNVKLSDEYYAHPRPTKYYEDPHALEPFEDENKGLNVWHKERNTLYRQLAAVEPPEFATTVPYTSQDTLYSYTKRIHKIQMKTLAHWFRKMEIVRIKRENELAVAQANLVLHRKKEYQAYKARRKAINQFNWTRAQQKRASELRTMYKRGERTEENLAQERAKKQAAQIELLLQEKRTSWITDSKNIDPTIFEEVSDSPTGWWPEERTKERYFRDDFLTDDEDRENYFTTQSVSYSRRRPEFGIFGPLYGDLKRVDKKFIE
jgi:hypothetical protein